MDYWDATNGSFPVTPILRHTYELDPPVGPASNDGPKSRKKSLVAAVACLQCRSRKVRCDAVQPKCNNCARRSEDCEYIVPKRRGPDKQPGGRVRTWWRKPAGYIDPQVSQRTKRKFDGQPDEPLHAVPESVRSATATRTAAEDFDLGSLLTSSLPDGSYPVPVDGPNPLWNLKDNASYNSDIELPIEALGFLPHTAQTNHVRFSPSHMSNDMPRGPSVIFNKYTWWDNLLQIYCENPSQSAQKIVQDVTFLFNNTIYWYSFIHLPLLLEKLRDPVQRIVLQPSIVFSALALSTLMKSYETGLGDKGRRHALMLRDAAQSSLEASISAGWIEPSLAQAALLLTLFEASTHPYHASSRLTSAIYLMDSLIQALGLLIMDVHEPTVSIFPVDEIPVTPANVLSLTLQPGGTPFLGNNQCQSRRPSTCPDASSEVVHVPSSPVSGTTQDWDEEFAEDLLKPLPSLQSLNTLEVRRTPRKTWLGLPPDEFDRVRDQTPQSDGGDDVDRDIIQKHPYWPDSENKAEIQREELRRLCWSALIVTTNLTEFTPYLEQSGCNLHITRQENFAIFFPGEAKAPSNSGSYALKETIWALHCRSILLWNVSQRLRLRPDWEFRKAEFSGRVWMEASCIESALAGHTCSVARGALFPVQDSLFQLKLLISNNFTRFIPLPHTLTFERNSAEEWLIHRGEIACHVRTVVYFISRFGAGPAALALAKRPLSIWWTLYQIRAGTTAWKSDRSLKYALEHSLDFVAFADFMTAMWPSPGQQAYYSKVKTELAEACMMAGVTIPAPIPIPGLPRCPQATMTPSPWLPKLPASADIPILPLD